MALGQRGTVFVNPYTGDVLGWGSARARAFYRSVTSWHRYLSVEAETARRLADHRRVQRGVPGARAQRDLLVVAEAVDVAARQCGHAVPIGAERQGQGLQLAQRDWVLVRADPRDSHRLRHGDFVHLGEQPGLHGDRQPEACAGCRARRRTRWRNRRRARRPRGRAGSRRPSPAEAQGRAEPGGGQPTRSEQTATDRAPHPPLATLASLVARAEQQVPTWRTMIVRLPQRRAVRWPSPCRTSSTGTASRARR